MERILVSLDASPHSVAALRVAAQLAAALQAELQGLFVEDDNLLRLCALPFGQEIGLFSAAPRPLDSRSVERQLRALAMSLRESMARVAGTMQVPWSFRVARGQVADELLAAAENATLLAFGRMEQSFANSGVATAQIVVQRSPRPVLILGKESQLVRPFTVVYTSTESAARALELATRLARRNYQSLQVIVQVDAAEVEPTIAQLTQSLAEQSVQPYFIRSADTKNLQNLIQARRHGTLILPVEYANLLPKLAGPLIVVP